MEPADQWKGIMVDHLSDIKQPWVKSIEQAAVTLELSRASRYQQELKQLIQEQKSGALLRTSSHGSGRSAGS